MKKEHPQPMESPLNKAALRLSALLLTVLLLLAGCGTQERPVTEEAPAAPTDDSIFTLRPAEEGEGFRPNGGYMPIALVLDADSESDGRSLAVQRGMETFGENFQYTLQCFTAEEAELDARVEALNEASRSGASIVVCIGEEMATALHTVQAEYPTVAYLLLGAEPHSADFADYTITQNVHSVLFHEEQAAFLAGYAAVSDGYTSLGFLGGQTMPDIVRTCAGFIQGAEAAAVQKGIQVTVKTWYSGLSEASDDLTARMSGWYTEGVELILAAGGNLEQSCIDATDLAGTGRVIAVGWDHRENSAVVLTSAVNRYSAVVQEKLYEFYTGGEAWDPEAAGRMVRLGAQEDAIALATRDWRFETFTPAAYDALYAQLRSGTQAVEMYADSTALPPTTNTTVEPQN